LSQELKVVDVAKLRIELNHLNVNLDQRLEDRFKQRRDTIGNLKTRFFKLTNLKLTSLVDRLKLVYVSSKYKLSNLSCSVVNNRPLKFAFNNPIQKYLCCKSFKRIVKLNKRIIKVLFHLCCYSFKLIEILKEDNKSAFSPLLQIFQTNWSEDSETNCRVQSEYCELANA
jgi:hypothetical protein